MTPSMTWSQRPHTTTSITFSSLSPTQGQRIKLHLLKEEDFVNMFHTITDLIYHGMERNLGRSDDWVRLIQINQSAGDILDRLRKVKTEGRQMRRTLKQPREIKNNSR